MGNMGDDWELTPDDFYLRMENAEFEEGVTALTVDEEPNMTIFEKFLLAHLRDIDSSIRLVAQANFMIYQQTGPQ